MLLAGCAHHRANPTSCRNPEFTGAAQNLPALHAPPGLNAPSSAAGVHIPALDQPEVARQRNGPCLDWPPAYVSEPPVPPTRRPAT